MALCQASRPATVNARSTRGSLNGVRIVRDATTENSTRDRSLRLERLRCSRRQLFSLFTKRAHTHTLTEASIIFHSRGSSILDRRLGQKSVGEQREKPEVPSATPRASRILHLFVFRSIARHSQDQVRRRTLSLTEDSSIIKFPRPSAIGELPDARMGATVEPRGGQRPTRSCSLPLFPYLSPISLRMFRPERTQSPRSCQVPHTE